VRREEVREIRRRVREIEKGGKRGGCGGEDVK